MNKTLLIGLVVIVLVGTGVLVMNSQKQPAQPTPPKTEQGEDAMEKKEEITMAKNAVEIKNFSFGPKNLTIKVGQRVTFTNKDAVGHTATADDDSFDTGLLEQNTSGSVTFDKAGTFTYHCTPHPNMKASIVVE